MLCCGVEWSWEMIGNMSGGCLNALKQRFKCLSTLSVNREQNWFVSG